MTISNNDAGIPVLTEVIPASPPNVPAVPDAPTPPAFLIKRATDPQSEVVHPPASSPWVAQSVTESVSRPVPPPMRRSAESPPPFSPVTDDMFKAMEHRISERVLAQMMSRIDFVLEQRIRDSISEVVQSAVANLSGTIREGLQHTLEEVISRAVAQEAVQLQKQKT